MNQSQITSDGRAGVDQHFDGRLAMWPFSSYCARSSGCFMPARSVTVSAFSSMPIVLIIGASRGIGLTAVKIGLSAGYEVRAVARSAHAIAINDTRLEKISGDARDSAVIVRALDGTGAVI